VSHSILVKNQPTKDIPLRRDFLLRSHAPHNYSEPPMPKNNVTDLITDQEIAFALLILS
jgi:hypothetical protein